MIFIEGSDSSSACYGLPEGASVPATFVAASARAAFSSVFGTSRHADCLPLP